MQGPQRPFESLDWYREAQGGRDDEHPWLTRLRSFSAVQAHISLFALGSVLLLAMNLVRSPCDVRADTWIAIWGLIVIMHAVVTGIASLVMQLVAGDDELRPTSEVRWDPMRTWQLPAAPPGTPVVGPIPVMEQAPPPPAVESVREDHTAPAPEPAAGPSAPSSWGIFEPREPAPASGERASWMEAAPAAWLARRHKTGQDEQAPEPHAAPDAPASEDGSDGSTPDREPHTRHPH
jgi:hypothetical protein